MPDELDKLLDDRASDQKEFEDAFEDILGKTDEEIEESLKKDKENEASGEGSGEPTKDQKNDSSESSYSFQKEQTPDPDPAKAKPAVVPDTSETETDWQKKALEAEEELKKEKQRTASWDGRIKAANEKTKKLEEQVATLLADKQAKVDTKTAAQDLSDKEKMDLFKENFPELADFADIMERKMSTIKPAKPAKVEPKVEPEVKPTQDDDSAAHYKAITDVHPDLDEMVKTGVLLTWINSQPDYIRPHLDAIYNKGNADDVIKMATEFKSKTGWKSSVASPEDTTKQDKLKAMLEANGESPGPKSEGPDKNDFAGTAKSIGL